VPAEGDGHGDVTGAQRRGDREIRRAERDALLEVVREWKRRRVEGERGAQRRPVALGARGDDLPGAWRHAVDRQPVLVVRQVARKLDDAGRGPQAPVLEAVRPRVQERDPHRGAALGVGAQPVLRCEQLLPFVAQRCTHHPHGRDEMGLERTGAQGDRGEAVERGEVRGRRARCELDGHVARSPPPEVRYTAVSPPSTLQSAPVT
jgi:hypothetical protein